MQLFWFGLIWLSGIALGMAAPLQSWQWLILSGGSVGGVLLFRRYSIHRKVFTAALVLFVGAIRFELSQSPPDPNHILHFNNSSDRIALVGIIVDPPDLRDTYTGLRVEAERIQIEGSRQSLSVQGLVLVRASRLESYAYGDRVEVFGYLESPDDSETFSYREYLARQGIHSLIPFGSVRRIRTQAANPFLQIIYDFRLKALETIYVLFPDPEASLLAGILLGSESGIHPDVKEAFNQTGTTHIIAISGFNITIIAAVFIALFGRWLGARRGAVVAGLAIVIYTLLVGADAAVVRAAIMGGLSLLARHLGRQTHGLASLSAAATVMTLFKPLVLWDVGFQLSFAAALGLVLYGEPLRLAFVRLSQRWLEKERAERLAGPVAEFLLLSLAAQVTTFPMTAHYFRRISLASFIANPVILPVQPALMISGGLAVLLGTLWLPLGRILAWIAWPFPAFTIRAVEFFAALPGSSIPLGEFSFPLVVIFYAALFGTTTWITLPQHIRDRYRIPTSIQKKFRVQTGVVLVTLAILTGLIWHMVARRPDGQLHVSILDVGSGDGVLIESPSGRYVLIDGGPSPIDLSEALGLRLPVLDRHLDWLIIAGTSYDQIAGLAGIVERLSIGNVLLSGKPSGSAFRRLMEELTEAGLSIRDAEKGQVLDLGDGVTLTIIALGDRGAAIEIEYSQARFLLVPGADPEMIAKLEKGRAVTALLVPDGGYSGVNPSEWLGGLRPWVAVISLEAGDRRGLPSPEVMEALSGSTILRTDQHGWIELMTDGEMLEVEVEKEANLP